MPPMSLPNLDTVIFYDTVTILDDAIVFEIGEII